jgi:hypothetical protein
MGGPTDRGGAAEHERRLMVESLKLTERASDMTTMTATVRNGRLELPRPIDLPDGTEIEIRLPEQTASDAGQDDLPMTPDEIARILAAMEKVEPLETSDEERAALEADRQARKEWEKARFVAHAEKLQSFWE